MAKEGEIIESAVARVSPDLLARHLEALTGIRHPSVDRTALARAAAYLFREFSSYGLEVREERIEGPGEYANIAARVKWEKDQKPIFFIGAHYDTVPGSPGADDNASGLAVMLEAARATADVPGVERLLFLGFTLEEEGFLGSGQFARQAAKNRLPLAGGIVLECVGYTDYTPGAQRVPPGLPIKVPDTGGFIGAIANERSERLKNFFEEAARRYAPALEVVSLVVPGNGEIFPDTRRSDHLPFWELGFAALQLTDTADFRNPHYHQPTDEISTLDLEFLADVTRAVVAAAASFAVAGDLQSLPAGR